MVAGRPKLALATAIATGAVKANPNRYTHDVDLSVHPLGPPSAEIIDRDLLDEWLFVIKSVSWLTEADRALVEAACIYRANRWELARNKVPYIDPDTKEVVPGVELIQIDHRAMGLELRILEKLGCTPTSRPKVTAPGKRNGERVKRDRWW